MQKTQPHDARRMQAVPRCEEKQRGHWCDVVANVVSEADVLNADRVVERDVDDAVGDCRRTRGNERRNVAANSGEVDETTSMMPNKHSSPAYTAMSQRVSFERKAGGRTRTVTHCR